MSGNGVHGWATASIGEVCRLVNGRAFKPTDWTKEGLRIVRIQNLNDLAAPFNHFVGAVDSRFLIDSGRLLFAWSGTPGTSFGAHIWARGKAILNQHIFQLHFDEMQLDKQFLRFAINSKLTELIGMAHGGSGLAHVTKPMFEATIIPVAPFAEQRRIVAKLGMLLSTVEVCQQRLAKIPPILKRFRQSILAAACSGRLTADWRDQQNSAVAWSKTTIDVVCEIIGGSQPPKKHFIHQPRSGYIRFIQIRDYKSDRHLTYIPRELARRFCSKTDVMIGRYGPPLFQILRGIEGTYNVALMKAVPKSRDKLLNDFLFLLLQNPPLRSYIINASERTVGQDGVRKDLLEAYEVELPPVVEQQEIVWRVEALFAFADKIEARIAKARAHVDRLTASLLAKAFRGELVPQDPNDEPASTLLERMRLSRQTAAESEPAKPAKPARVRRHVAVGG
ncbi:MAG: restriction endonuclease subunit S [Opitutaceae bacterium]|nr:restriction endonuclease subunit S [Opitutaceae bacterium]